FHRRPAAIGAIGRNDRLVKELEAALLERTLQLLQPLDLTGVAGERLVPRRVHGHPAGALLLGDIAGGIGRGEQLLDRAALTRDLHQAHRDANDEYLVPPHEAMLAHRAADI